MFVHLEKLCGVKASGSMLKGHCHSRGERPHACISCQHPFLWSLIWPLKYFRHAKQIFQLPDYSNALHLFFHRELGVHFSWGERHFPFRSRWSDWRSHISSTLGLIYEYFKHLHTLLRQHAEQRFQAPGSKVKVKEDLRGHKQLNLVHS